MAQWFRRLWLGCLLSVALPAQECQACGDERTRTCDLHAALRQPMQELGIYLAWAKAPCCQLTGVVPCKACLAPADLKKWLPEPRRQFEEHYHRTKYDGNLRSLRTIAEVVAHLGGDLLSAGSNHFMLVTDPVGSTLKLSAYKRMQPELRRVAKLLPGLLEPEKRQLQAQDWALLHLLRCEELYRAYWSLLGLEDAPDFMRRAPRIEAFLLHDETTYEAYKAVHDKSDRVYGSIERFACRVQDRGWFPGEELPADRHLHTALAHRVGSALTDRMIRWGIRFEGKTPFFLDQGMAHVLEIETSGKAVMAGGRSERAGSSGSEWEPSNWHKQFFRKVGKKRKDGSSAAPTFAQLVAVDNGTAEFDHHLAAWSLMTFLRLQPDDGKAKLVAFMKAVRSGDSAPDALFKVYGVQGDLLTNAWHTWVRDNERELLPPVRPLQAVQAEATLASFEQVMAAKPSRSVSPEEFVIRRRGAIATLRWAPAEAAVAHLLAVMRGPNELEALTARQTLRMVEMRTPVVASLLWEALEAALQEATAPAYRVHLVRAVGAQAHFRRQLAPMLHDLLQSQAAGFEVLAATAQTLGELGDPESQAALEAATRSDHPLLRAEATTALGKLSRESALHRATELINDPSWHVRIASIDIFRHLALPECVPPLFKRLPLENGRLAEDIGNALLEITRLANPFETGEQWQHWWETGGRESMLAARNPTAGAPATSADFVGEEFPPIRSKRFMFMVDVSSSMGQSVLLKPKPGATTAGGKDIETTKIRFVVDKLAQLICDKNEIPDDVIFDIALFARQPRLWKRELVPATPANRQAAARFLRDESRSQQATTDLQQALAAALDAADESLRTGRPDAAIDTVYLITDGSPTEGLTDLPLLREWLRERNRNHRIKIFVITVGATDTDIGFLRLIAAENFGPRPVVVRHE